MSSYRTQFRALPSSALLIAMVAALIIVFNGGINVGQSNHAGLLPVVRRILDSNYLPDDFGIAVRFYHHRVFAYLLAGFSALFGEDNALILLAVIGMTLLSGALFVLCRAVGLRKAGFLIVGLFLATRLAWTGLGLEENTFAGNADIMPTTFAHATLLLATASLLKEKYRLTSLFAGITLLLHLQIGLILAVVLFPFFVARLRASESALKEEAQRSELDGLHTSASSAVVEYPQQIQSADDAEVRREKLDRRTRSGESAAQGSSRASELAAILALFLAPASPALIHFFEMLASGLSNSSFTLDYIKFRHPHHFELQSASAAAWVLAQLATQCAACYWLRKKNRPEARAIGVLMKMSLMIVALSLLHFLDYYVLQIGTISKIQLLRLSPVITVFGTLSLATALTKWEEARRREGQSAARLRPATVCLISIALFWSGYCLIRWPSAYKFGVTRYAAQENSWVDMCRWVRDHGAAGAIYITPPDKGGFTYLTNRSTVVEFKINPDGGLYLSEWYERLRDVCGGSLPEARGYQNYPGLRQAYASLSSDQLSALAEKYNAGWAILPATSTIDFEIVYRNEDYKLVAIPPGGTN